MTGGEEIFQSLYATLLDVSHHTLVSISTDGVPAMTSENVGLIGLYKKNPISRTFLVITMSFISKVCVQK
jgi:hypothetical protein